MRKILSGLAAIALAAGISAAKAEDKKLTLEFPSPPLTTAGPAAWFTMPNALPNCWRRRIPA